jgi:hypothetical protein
VGQSTPLFSLQQIGIPDCYMGNIFFWPTGIFIYITVMKNTKLHYFILEGSPERTKGTFTSSKSYWTSLNVNFSYAVQRKSFSIIAEYLNKVHFFSWNTSFGSTPNVLLPVILDTIRDDRVELWEGVRTADKFSRRDLWTVAQQSAHRISCPHWYFNCNFCPLFHSQNIFRQSHEMTAF